MIASTFAATNFRRISISRSFTPSAVSLTTSSLVLQHAVEQDRFECVEL